MIYKTKKFMKNKILLALQRVLQLMLYINKSKLNFRTLAPSGTDNSKHLTDNTYTSIFRGGKIQKIGNKQNFP